MFQNIPDELKQLNQWCLWRYEETQNGKPTKVPYTIRNSHASTMDSSTWCSFNDAVANVNLGYSGIGFIFSDSDCYAGIDLDEAKDVLSAARQQRVFEEFNSYSERSPSGKGLHIIIKASVPQGRKRSDIELYSSGRFFTFTGNVFNNAAIEERQELATSLWEQLGSPPSQYVFHGELVEKEPDEAVLKDALNASNGDKFKTLLDGKWQDLYASQSEADIAFINIVAHYTQNRAQIARIFHASPLGKRDKAKRHDYLSWMINKSFDKILPPIDLEGWKVKVETDITAKVVIDEPISDNKPEYPMSRPPGLLGDIADYIWAQSPRQVPEAAICAAIGLLAGICGRSYNVSATGLNQYVLYVATTGTGKEGIASGIAKLMRHVVAASPASQAFLGPTQLPSGEGIIRYMNDSQTKSFLSLVGEAGHFIQRLTNTDGNPTALELHKVILDLYNKSGAGNSLGVTSYSDKTKNTNVIYSPAFSMLGESNPAILYKSMDEDMIATGLLPRFTIIEYYGKRPPLNHSHDKVVPSDNLVGTLARVCVNALTAITANVPITVHLNTEAQNVADEFDRYADAQINNSAKDVVKQLWNRSHIKLLKLAALVAVGENCYNPVISLNNIMWAKNMVMRDIDNIMSRFDKGSMGNLHGENKQQTELTRICHDYLTAPFDKIKNYGALQALHTDKIIPYNYFNRRLISAAAFRNDKAGATAALKRTINTLIEIGVLIEVGKTDLCNKYNTKQRAFIVTDIKVLV